MYHTRRAGGERMYIERGDMTTHATDGGTIGGRSSIVLSIKADETGGEGRARISCNARDIVLRL